ncbi:MAG: 3-dehydroquinate synthase [Planctomycetaceae bacterium]|nr:3-dehydroquinate synthase [Planctomycetaceae bacterium]
MNPHAECPAETTTLTVSLGSRSYEIEIGTGNLSRAGKVLAAFKPVSLAYVLTDTNVQAHGYADKVASSITQTGMRIQTAVIPAGEESKSLQQSGRLWNEMCSCAFPADRQTVLAAVGGGVAGDLGGFLAANYMRGIRFFQIPTTLLAQVDSSVGGKVAVNLPGAKNMIGAFHQPVGVLIDTETLQTLPEKEYLSGLGEVVKYAVSLDAGLYGFLENNTEKIRGRDNAVLRHIIAECCRIKARIVSEDERETAGKRILLNYGHTFAHAFEVMSRYTLPHGLAVAAGLICAAKTARKAGLVDDNFVRQQTALHQALNLPAEIPAGFDRSEMFRLMRLDKKTESGVLRLVLPTRLGECRVVEGIEPAAFPDA